MIFETIDHTTTGVDRLTYKLRQPNIEALLSLFLAKNDELESAIAEIGNIKDIDTATGIWLDYIGKIIGESRNNLDDDDYRIMIKRRISINTADGTPDKIISLIKQFTESTDVKLTESGYAFGTISVKKGENISGELYDLLQEIKPAATRWLIHSDYYDTNFIAAYEEGLFVPELFYTVDASEGEDVFQVTSNGGTYNNFYVVKEDASYYKETVVEDRNTFFYEDAFSFQVTTDGTTYEDFTLSNGKDFRVVVPYEQEYTPTYGGISLNWEITEGSGEINEQGYFDMLDFNSVYDALSTTFTTTVSEMMPYVVDTIAVIGEVLITNDTVLYNIDGIASNNLLECDGSTFDETVYLGLYEVLGTNVLPDLETETGSTAPYKIVAELTQ